MEAIAAKKKTLNAPKASILAFSDEIDDVTGSDGLVLAQDENISPNSNLNRFSMGRKSLAARRRSSVGGISSRPPLSEAEQMRIAEMYKTVIQMSSENVSHICGSGYFSEIFLVRN
jgi:hypothetical protein